MKHILASLVVVLFSSQVFATIGEFSECSGTLDGKQLNVLARTNVSALSKGDLLIENSDMGSATLGNTELTDLNIYIQRIPGMSSNNQEDICKSEPGYEGYDGRPYASGPVEVVIFADELNEAKSVVLECNDFSRVRVQCSSK